MKAFYKDSVTNDWKIVHDNGNIEIVVAGTCTALIADNQTKVFIREKNTEKGYAVITELEKNSGGDLYSNTNDFLNITKSFFIGSTDINTSSLSTSENQETELGMLDDIKTILSGLSTSAKQDALKAVVDTLATAAKQEDIKTLLGTINTSVNNSGGSQFKTFSVEITRPANTTVYSANDVVADVSAAFVQFSNVAKSIASGVKITRVRIQTEDTGVAGKKFNLHLYKEAPTFIADNAAFAISYANSTKRIGAIPVVMGTGNLGTVGMNDYDHMITNPTAKDIYWILETVDGFTPSANSTKFTVVIDCELSN